METRAVCATLVALVLASVLALPSWGQTPAAGSGGAESGVIAIPSLKRSEWMGAKPAGDADWLTFSGLRFGVEVGEQMRRCGPAERWTGCWMGQAVYFADRLPGLDAYADYLQDDGVLVHIKAHLAAAREAEVRAALEERYGRPEESGPSRALWRRHGLRIEMFGTRDPGQAPRIEVCPLAWYERVQQAVAASEGHPVGQTPGGTVPGDGAKRM